MSDSVRTSVINESWSQNFKAPDLIDVSAGSYIINCKWFWLSPDILSHVGGGGVAAYETPVIYDWQLH